MSAHTPDPSRWLSDLMATQPDADDWLATAHGEPGSWWPTWYPRLKPYASAVVPAPRSAGNAQHPATEPVPGRYVKAEAP